MRLFQASVLAVLSLVQSLSASPFPAEYDGILLNRRCDKLCGWNLQLCCTSSQTCGTNSADQAVCLDSVPAASAPTGSWQYFTTTITRTDLVTVVSTYSSYVTPAPVATVSCSLSLGESVCGSNCCSAAEICQNGACIAGSSPIATATAPLRPTSSGVTTVTTTLGFIAPVNTNGATVVAQASGGGGLSGGAIAGIVIGVIAGLILLFIICTWFCAKGALNSLLAIFGLGPRRRRDKTYVDERYSHHSHGERPERSWFGTRPSRPEVGEKKKSGFGFLTTLAVIGGTIALWLGLRKRDNDKSDYNSTYYTYSYEDYSTSASSESSDRRNSRRSRSRSYR